MSIHAEQFAVLPEAIQEQLVRISRLAAGMSTTEKAVARTVFGHTATSLALHGDDSAVEAGEMLSALGMVTALADAYARPVESGAV